MKMYNACTQCTLNEQERQATVIDEEDYIL